MKLMRTSFNISVQMERLKLNGNKIGDEGGRALSTCLSKVKSLDITQCGINEEGSKAMAASIKSFPFDVNITSMNVTLSITK